MGRAGKDLRKAAADVQRLSENIERLVDVNIRQAMQRVSAATRQNIVQGPSRYRQVVSGTLLQSVHTRDTNAQSLDDIELGSDTYTSWSTIVDAPHAPYVEYGTGARQRGAPGGLAFPPPSLPPTGWIAKWIQQKGIQARNPKYIDEDGTTNVYALATAIAEDISQKGQRPHPFARPAWFENEETIKSAHRQGVRKALRSTF